VAGVGQQMELASAGSGAEGFHLGGSDPCILATGDGQDGSGDGGHGGHGIGTRGEASLHGDKGLRGQRHAGAQFGYDLGMAFAGGCADQVLGHAVKEAPRCCRLAPGRWWRRGG
jgi:hypothetical protein